MSGDFEGKVALVTGGATGIGQAIAGELGARGASVLIADVNEEGAADTAAGIDGAVTIGCDVGDPEAVEAAVASAVERFGGLDVMVNNAGVELAGPLTETTTEAAERVIRVNVLGVFNGIKYAAPKIAERGGGAIVSTASGAGLRGAPMQGFYASSKAAVINLTQTAAIELRPLGVRVNCVCPGVIETPMLARLKEEFEAMVPMTIEELIAAKQGRGGEPADIARAVAYLASERAEFVSGVALPVDNAFSAGIY
jgi:galactitol 2-dehydrogenase